MLRRIVSVVRRLMFVIKLRYWFIRWRSLLKNSVRLRVV